MLWRTRHGESEAGGLLKFRTGVVVPEEPTAAPKATQALRDAASGRSWQDGGDSGPCAPGGLNFGWFLPGTRCR